MARMSERHYTIIAENIRECSEGASPDVRTRLERLTLMLANFFAEDNQRFKRNLFIEQAGF